MGSELLIIIVIAALLAVLAYYIMNRREAFQPKVFYLNLQRAHERLQGGDLDGAEKEYSEAIRLAPQHPVAYLGRAGINLVRHHYDAATADLNQAATLTFTDQNADLNQHRIFSYLGVPPEDVFNYRALAHYSKGDIEGAIVDFSEALRLRPQHVLALFSRADLYLQKGENAAAIRDYSQGLLLAPNTPEVYFNRAVAYRRIGEYDKALADCEKCIQLDPNQKTEVFTERGWIKFFKGDLDGALADCNRTLEMLPQSPFAYQTRGNVWLKQKDWDRAIEDYSRAIEFKHPELYYPYFYRGYSYFKKGNLETAVEDYNKAIQSNPQFTKALDYRGYTHGLMGNIEQAMADCNQAIKRLPQSPDAYVTRGYILFSIGRLQESLADFEKAFELKQDYWFALAGQAITLHAAGRVDEAKQRWSSLIEQDPRFKNPDFLKEEYDCGEAFVDEARKLLTKL